MLIPLLELAALEAERAFRLTLSALKRFELVRARDAFAVVFCLRVHQGLVDITRFRAFAGVPVANATFFEVGHGFFFVCC